MSTNPQQILLSFPTLVDMSAESFMLLPSNHQAFMALQNFPATSGDVLAIYGESGVGKSHLAEIYKQRTGAEDFMHKSAQNSLDLTAEKHMVCDNVHLLKKDEQEALFHLYNHIKSFGGSLVVTSHQPISQLDLLPDLKSRLLTAPQIQIEQPTDAHLEVLLVKMAADKQMYIEPKVVTFILKNCHRSVFAISHVLTKLDALSLEQKRKITVPLVKEALGL
ncbi:MAG: hypothetical protein CMF60_02225 [Magnetococcales bacterium]|nr:hypothetical protein [Magnetococcales bacterium]|tara:strand:+ start:52001 stop:52663 length:663 start_codon:yes stop_codon:yes gene_type:complete